MISYKNLHEDILSDKDIEELCLMRNDKDVQKFLNIRNFTKQNYSDTKSWIENKIKTKNLILCSYFEEEFLGYCFGEVFDPGGSLKKGFEISFALKRKFWNKGYAFKLISKFIYLSKLQNCKFLIARVISDNISSQKLLRKLLFEKVAVFDSVTVTNSDLIFYQLNL